MDFFNVVGGSGWVYLVASGVKVAGKTLYRTALSSGIPALKTQNNRNPQTVNFTVKNLKALLQFIQFLFILVSGQLL